MESTAYMFEDTEDPAYLTLSPKVEKGLSLGFCKPLILLVC